MDWDALGAMGEIVGAIAVLATLYYLSNQIKINAKQVEKANDYQRAQSTLAGNDYYLRVWQPLMQDAELASIYLKGIKEEPLDAVGEFRFCTYINTFLAWMEAAMMQIKSELSFSEFNDNTDDMAALFEKANPYLSKLLNTSVGRKWLEEEAQSLFADEFLENLYKYGPLADKQKSA